VKPKRVESNSFINQASPNTLSGIRIWNKAEELTKVFDIEESKEYIEEPKVCEEEKVEEAPFDSDNGKLFCESKKDKNKKGKGM
jgi:hypothetical protein